MSSLDISKMKKLDEEYGMFRTLNSDDVKGDFLFSVDDSFVTEGMETLCCSEILEGYNPPFEADSVTELRKAGGFLTGKTNMDEFGIGPFIVNGAYGIPKNPYDESRTCGGPSAGAACAASLLKGSVSLTRSTCGSLSGSAAYCGVYGMVPTYGKISKDGVIDAGSSIDRVGVSSSDFDIMEKYAKLLMNYDEKDSETKIIGIPVGITNNVSEDVKNNFEENLAILKSMGFETKTVELPSMKHAAVACRILTITEASTNMSRYCGMRYGKQDGDYTLESDEFFTSVRTEHFGTQTKKNILLGTYMRMEGTSERYYNKSRMVRDLIIEEYQSVFKECDVILTPTVESVAPLISETADMSMIESFSAEKFTAPADLAGMPVLSVPCGYDNNGMPMGMMFVANHYEENKLFSLCKAWSDSFDFVEPEAIL